MCAVARPRDPCTVGARKIAPSGPAAGSHALSRRAAVAVDLVRLLCELVLVQRR